MSSQSRPTRGTVSSLPDALSTLTDAARSRDLTIAVAESLTSGLLAGAVGKGEKSSEWFAGGVVAYQLRVKEDVLGVRKGIDPCSAECAEQLAAGVRKVLGADIAVSTTGVGGPDPQDGHAPGTVYLGWSTGEETGHLQLQIGGEVEDVLDQAVQDAVELLAQLATRD